jgi:glycosyltransferase involved in cell wall biosynthesis
VLLTTDVVGGVWDFSLTLAAELRADWQVTLLVLGEPSATHRRQAESAGAALRVEPVKLEWMQDSSADVAYTRQCVASIAAEGFDLIHANQFAAACADTDVPVVLTLHSDVQSWRRWTLGASAVSAEWVGYTGLVREALVRASHVVAVSRFLADEVKHLYDRGADIDVIHNGWPTTTGDEDGGRREPVTVIAGRVWDNAKNIALAAEAANGWSPGDVQVAGEQQHPETGSRVDLPPPLHALGMLRRPELEDLLERASLYLSPARYDPFGLLPLQAAHHGCALLLSDIPSYRELWDGAACFFRSDDADDLRRKWQLLLDQPDTRHALSRVARIRAGSSYSAANMAAAYRGLYARTRMKLAA